VVRGSGAMSRIGRMLITISAGVKVTVGDDNFVKVEGPMGSLERQFHPNMAISKEENTLTVKRPDDEKTNRSLHGLSRTLLNNMILGVTEGFSKELQISGVGYKAAKQGKKLVLNLGYSHQIFFEESENLTFEVPQQDKIIVKGISKQQVGQIAAEIRGKRPPEPYLGKGVKYASETVRRKAGKAGK